MEVTIENINQLILPSEDFVASGKMCTICGDDKNLKLHKQVLVCEECIRHNLQTQEERAIGIYTISPEKAERLKYLKVMKFIPRTKYRRGQILTSCVSDPDRFYFWYVNRRGQDKVRLLGKDELTVWVFKGYVKFISKEEL